MSIHVARSHSLTMPRQKLLHPVPGARRGHSAACKSGLMSGGALIEHRTAPLQDSSAKNLQTHASSSCQIVAEQHNGCAPLLGLAVSLPILCSKADSQAFRAIVLRPVPAQLPQSHVER